MFGLYMTSRFQNKNVNLTIALLTLGITICPGKPNFALPTQNFEFEVRSWFRARKGELTSSSVS